MNKEKPKKVKRVIKAIVHGNLTGDEEKFLIEMEEDGKIKKWQPLEP